MFVTADLVALSVQGVGGALAAIAAGNHKDPEKGGKIMLGGIVFQMIAITIYMALAIEFVYRFWHHKPFKGREDVSPSGRYLLDHNMKLMLAGATLSSLLIYVRYVQQAQPNSYAVSLILQSRSVYRTIELVDGWEGRIIKNELYFNVMDGAMIVASMFCLNVFHPGRLLGPGGVPVMGIADFDSIEKAKGAGELCGCACAPKHIIDELPKFKIWRCCTSRVNGLS